MRRQSQTCVEAIGELLVANGAMTIKELYAAMFCTPHSSIRSCLSAHDCFRKRRISHRLCEWTIADNYITQFLTGNYCVQGKKILKPHKITRDSATQTDISEAEFVTYRLADNDRYMPNYHPLPYYPLNRSNEVCGWDVDIV